MPNWCFNVVQFTHEDVEKVDAIERELDKGENTRLFESLRPQPEGEEDWYSYNVNNWGTKWDASVLNWERVDENTVMVEFDTAWSPPIHLYEFLHEEEGFDVDAMYHEGGMGFCGSWVDGQEDYYDYDLADKSTWESIPEDLIDFAGLESEYESWIEENDDSA